MTITTTTTTIASATTPTALIARLVRAKLVTVSTHATLAEAQAVLAAMPTATKADRVERGRLVIRLILTDEAYVEARVADMTRAFAQQCSQSSQSSRITRDEAEEMAEDLGDYSHHA